MRGLKPAPQALEGLNGCGAGFSPPPFVSDFADGLLSGSVVVWRLGFTLCILRFSRNPAQVCSQPVNVDLAGAELAGDENEALDPEVRSGAGRKVLDPFVAQGDFGRERKAASGGAGPAEHQEQAAARIVNLDRVGRRVGHVQPAGPVHGDSLRPDHLPDRLAERSDDLEQPSLPVELLDPRVERVADVQAPVRAEGQVGRLEELSGRAARLAELAQETAAHRVKNQDRIAFEIRHKQFPVVPKGVARFHAAGASDGANGGVGGIEHQDVAPAGVGDILLTLRTAG